MKKILSLLLIATSFICLTACSNEGNKEELPNIPKEHYMAVGESFNLGYKTNWVSSNTFSATVDGEGVITAVRFGEAKIYSTSNDLSCNVFVYPSYSLYSDPITQGGISKDELKEELGTPYSEGLIEEGVEIIVYETDNKIAPVELYILVNDSLAISGVFVDETYSEKLATHLLQQYKFLNYNEAEGRTSYIDAESFDDVNTIVGVMPIPEYPNHLLVIYILNPEADTETKATRSNSYLFDKIDTELLPVNISQTLK